MYNFFLAQNEYPELSGGEAAAAAAAGGIMSLLYLAVIVVIIIGMWKIFTKAGKPGWASIVPIYNIIVLL